MQNHTETNPLSDTVLMKGEDYELTKRLKATLLQYVKLYERWSEDRQEWTKKLVEVEETYLRFDTAVNKFDEVDKNFRASLKGFILTESQHAADAVKASLQETVDEVKQAIHQTARDVKAEIRDAATKEIKKSTTDLNYEIDKARNSLNAAIGAYNQVVSWQFWKATAIATFASVVASAIMLMIVFKAMPKPVLPISDEQIEYLHLGQSMAVIWPKLTKAEQERLKKLAADASHSAGI